MAVLWISLLIILFDQITKMMIKGSPWSFLPWKGMPYGSSVPFIDDIVRITYIENPGIAFGITIPGFKVVFAIFSIVASIGILWYMSKNSYRLRVGERIALALILGGAVGNLIDRVFYGLIYHEPGRGLFYGQVVDFIDFGLHRNMFPVFNVADSAVSVGVVLLIILLMKHKPTEVGPETASFQDPNTKHHVSFEAPSVTAVDTPEGEVPRVLPTNPPASNDNATFTQ